MVTLDETARVPYRPADHRVEQIRTDGESQDHKTSLIRIQHEQAEAASGKIGRFIREIEAQLGWTTQLPWIEGTLEQRRVDAVRLLRQVPAITELAQIDPSGTERLRVSRLA